MLYFRCRGVPNQGFFADNYGSQSRKAHDPRTGGLEFLENNIVIRYSLETSQSVPNTLGQEVPLKNLAILSKRASSCIPEKSSKYLHDKHLAYLARGGISRQRGKDDPNNSGADGSAPGLGRCI